MEKKRGTRTVMAALGDLLKGMFGSDPSDAVAHHSLGGQRDA